MNDLKQGGNVCNFTMRFYWYFERSTLDNFHYLSSNPHGRNFFNFMQFSEIWESLKGRRLNLGEILDPPLTCCSDRTDPRPNDQIATKI